MARAPCSGAGQTLTGRGTESEIDTPDRGVAFVAVPVTGCGSRGIYPVRLAGASRSSRWEPPAGLAECQDVVSTGPARRGGLSSVGSRWDPKPSVRAVAPGLETGLRCALVEVDIGRRGNSQDRWSC